MSVPRGVGVPGEWEFQGGWEFQGDGCSRGMSVLGDGCQGHRNRSTNYGLGGWEFLIPMGYTRKIDEFDPVFFPSKDRKGVVL